MRKRHRLPWFRMHTGLRTDARLRTLPDDEFRTWFALLSYAAEQDERGAINEPDNLLLAIEVASGDEELLSRTVTSLARLKIITVEEATLRFVNFTSEQYDSPSDEPEATRERKRRQRERSHQSTDGHAMSRNVTPSHEERREEKMRTEETRSETDQNYADASGVSDSQLQRLTEKFDAFWAQYPNRTSRQDAVAEFQRLSPSDDLFAQIMAAIARQRTWRNWQDGYVPSPGNWLKGQRWNDEEPPAQMNKTRSDRYQDSARILDRIALEG